MDRRRKVVLGAALVAAFAVIFTAFMPSGLRAHAFSNSCYSLEPGGAWQTTCPGWSGQAPGAWLNQATSTPVKVVATATVVPGTATAPPATGTATTVPPTGTATTVPPTGTATTVPPTGTATTVPPTSSPTTVLPTAVVTRTAVATAIPPTPQQTAGCVVATQTPPVVSSLSPNSGTPGTTVTISGSGFTPYTTEVQFGSEGTVYTVNSDTQITAVAPVPPPGVTYPYRVQVTVTNTCLEQSAPGFSSRFTYTSGPLAIALANRLRYAVQP